MLLATGLQNRASIEIVLVFHNSCSFLNSQEVRIGYVIFTEGEKVLNTHGSNRIHSLNDKFRLKPGNALKAKELVANKTEKNPCCF
jgi:hypothetical protein